MLRGLLLILLAGPALAGELVLVGEAKEHAFVRVDSDVAGTWLVYGPQSFSEQRQAGVFPTRNTTRREVLTASEKKQAIFVGPPGQYLVIQVGDDGEPAELLVEVVGDKPPVPPGPVPPGPTPPPPEPEPNPSPIPGQGLRVVFFYESSKALTPAQLTILNGAKVRAWLDKNCAKGKGGLAEWRMYDIDADVSREPSAELKEGIQKNRPTQVPWVLIGNGRSGYSGPLPANEDEAIVLLEKYKG